MGGGIRRKKAGNEEIWGRRTKEGDVIGWEGEMERQEKGRDGARRVEMGLRRRWGLGGKGLAEEWRGGDGEGREEL